MAKNKRINIITLERAQHEDLMRGDAFGVAALGEVLRSLYDDHSWPETFPGYIVRSTITEAPLRAHVLAGLMVRPANAAYLLVDSGSMLACITPASGDDSILELVQDPGVVSTSVLTFTANASGSSRLDIVECSVVDTVLESDTRGIFDTTTRDFDPQSVDKVLAPQLSYRIRNGVAGSGLPAVASGWLPLAVVCVLPSAVGFTQCEMWDVRPLVSDRVKFSDPPLDPGNVARSHYRQLDGYWSCRLLGLNGYAASKFNGYIAGGDLIANTAFPIADQGNSPSGLSLNYVPSQTPGLAMPSGGVIHVAALFPGGLPRWVKYIDPGSVSPTGSRIPYGPRGLLVVTAAQPDRSGYFSGVMPPAASGFTVAAPGVSLAALAGGPTVFDGICDRGNVTIPRGAALILGGKAGEGTGTVTWTFNPSTFKVPANAAWVDLSIHVVSSGAQALHVSVQNTTGSIGTLFDRRFQTVADDWVNVRIPLVHNNADGAQLDTLLTLGVITGGPTITTAVAEIVGYGMN